MMKRILKAAGIFLAVLAASASVAAAEAGNPPILHVHRGNVDAAELIRRLAPEGTDIESVLEQKERWEGYGEEFGIENPYRDTYTLSDMSIHIMEPTGQIGITWTSPTIEAYERTEAELKEKYDPDGDYYLDDGETFLYTNEQASPDELEQRMIEVGKFVQEIAGKLGYTISEHSVSGGEETAIYPGGERLVSGRAVFGMIRGGLAVETHNFYSEIASSNLYIPGERIQVSWYGDEICSMSIVHYEIDKEESAPNELISEEQARKAVQEEIDMLTSMMGTEPYVDLCYMPTLDAKGILNAQLVPAWRFRFSGPYREEDFCHRVNAYTGKVIR